MITELAGALAQLGAVVHGGGVVAFAALFALRGRLSFVDDVHLVRIYRGWGAGNGLSLAAWVYGTILRYPSQVNPGDPLPWAYLPDFGGIESSLKSVTAIVMLVLWVSYVVLEIWTLDPGRLLDRDGVVTDERAFQETVRRVTGHLGFNAMLVIAIALCVGVGGRI